MDKLKYIKLENDDGSYSDSIPLAVDSDHVDVNGASLTTALANKATKTEVNAEIANLSAVVNSLASGSPAGVYATVAALTTADPDHSKIYVVTADGHWYYYNNGWQDGGVYQSSGISDNTINRDMLDENLKSVIYKNIGTNIDINNADNVHLMKQSGNNVFIDSNNANSLVIPIKANTCYVVRKMVSKRFALYLSENYPVAGGAISSSNVQAEAQILKITSGNNDKYLTIYYYNASSDTTSPEVIKASIKVYEGDWQDDLGYGEYLNEKVNNINKNLLNTDLKNAIYKTVGTDLDITNCNTVNLVKHTSEDIFVSGTSGWCLVVPIENNTKYIVQKIASTRFALYLSKYYPLGYVEITNRVADNSATELEITSGVDDNYLSIYFYNSESDTLTEAEIKNSIVVYKNNVVIDETWTDNLKSESILSDKYIKLVSTKYLGPLTKGYIAISCDDGTNNLSDITVDIFKGYKTTYNKNIPLTMGLMSNSAIFSDNARKEKVLELIEDYGASVAIHGAISYLRYTEQELFNFLNTQKTFLTTNLTAPTSIIYPNHDYNEKTSTIAGTFYGVCCTGGVNTPIAYGGDACIVAGPRSNMYTLRRTSLFGTSMTTQKIKDAIDYAYEHNMIYLPFFHDNTLASDYERCKPLLDYCVQYANEKGLEFINVGDIPNII